MSCNLLRFMPGLLGCLLVANYAYAERLDISRLTRDGEFSATLGAAFKSGFNAAHSHQTDLGAGRLNNLGVNMAYSPTENTTCAFTTSNNYSDSQVGIQYKLVKNRPFKLDFMADYGIAWTKNAETHRRIGNNNADFGLRTTGIIWHNWQWSFDLMPQFVWARPHNFWNLNSTSQLMYYFSHDVAVKTKFDFNVVQIARPKTLYDKTVTLGIVYNFTKKAAVNPFVQYHFKSANFKNDFVSYYDWWKFGLAVSAQF